VQIFVLQNNHRMLYSAAAGYTSQSSEKYSHLGRKVSSLGGSGGYTVAGTLYARLWLPVMAAVLTSTRPLSAMPSRCMFACVLFCSWNDRYITTGATTTFGRCISISNGSQIILLATDDPETHVRRATQNMDPSTAWVAIAYDPQGSGSSFDSENIVRLSMETAADGTAWQQLMQKALKKNPPGSFAATAQPCAVVLMFSPMFQTLHSECVACCHSPVGLPPVGLHVVYMLTEPRGNGFAVLLSRVLLRRAARCAPRPSTASTVEFNGILLVSLVF
jgi:hypothetical protein